jgi:hypothetical protein
VFSGVGEVSWAAPHWDGVRGGEGNLLISNKGAFDFRSFVVCFF